MKTKFISKIVPKIAIDARMVSEIPHGISRYVTELARGLSELNELNYEPIFLVNSNISSKLREKYFYPFKTISMKYPFLSTGELIEIPIKLSQLNAALYHSPSFSSLWYCPCPYIATIHDLNHLHFGSILKKIYYKSLLKKSLYRASSILTVSEFSKNELAIWLGIEKNRITITYNAVNKSNLEGKNHLPLLPIENVKDLKPNQYFICLSNSKPHKNLRLLAEAYTVFKDQHPNAWPLLMTTAPFTQSNGLYFIGTQPEAITQSLLANAGGMLFPSIYEGFGLPPLEAALHGTPLAVSQIPPHQEGLIDLKQNEVLWVPPTDLGAWVNAFRALSEHEVSRTSSESQNKILTRFSTKRLTQSLDCIYRSMLENKR